MAPWDRWWNRNFPAYSWRRLFFLLACMPVVAMLVTWLRTSANGDPFSWSNVFMTVLMGWGILPLMWVHIRAQRDAKALDDIPIPVEAVEEATRRQGPPPPPPPLPVAVDTPSGPRWRGPSGPDPEALGALMSAPVKRKRSPVSDFLLAYLVAFAGMIFVIPNLGGGDFSLSSVLMAAVSAFAFCIALLLRHSLLFVVIISMLGGIPIAAIIEMFSMFMGDSGWIWAYWAFSAAGIFLFLMPFWMNMRQLRKRPEVASMPLWLISSCSMVMIVIVSTSVSFTGGGNSAGAAPGAGGGIRVGQPGPQVGARSDQEAALHLLFAWRNGDRKQAHRVAHPTAARDLLGRPYDPSARFFGCGRDAGGAPRCVIGTTSELILLGYATGPAGRTYVDFVERARVGTAFTYAWEPSAAATASP